MLGTVRWRKRINGRLFSAFVISSLLSAFLLGAWGCAGFQPYNGRCPRGEYWSSTAEQCVKEPGPGAVSERLGGIDEVSFVFQKGSCIEQMNDNDHRSQVGPYLSFGRFHYRTECRLCDDICGNVTLNGFYFHDRQYDITNPVAQTTDLLEKVFGK